jgi:hypothetical protein
MSTSGRRGMTSSGSGRQRRHAKLVVRRSFSLTPSPSNLPSPVSSSPRQALHTPHSQAPPASPPPASPSPPVLVRPLLLNRATRQLLESQAHHILQRLSGTPQEVSHGCEKEKGADSALVESQKKLESELDQILKCLHECRDEQDVHAEQEESCVGQDLIRLCEHSEQGRSPAELKESYNDLNRAHSSALESACSSRIASSAVRIIR